MKNKKVAKVAKVAKGKLLRDQAKKHGKKADLSEFRGQLDILGLKIIEVISDGNCFFRSIADQLEGNEEEHTKYRSMVVQYIMNKREEFEPFIEDEIKFEDYCKSMLEDGTWAGHMELQAASLVIRTNICIHQLSMPRWYINNFGSNEVNMIHLSYHHGEHYNSVRLREDPCDGPARPISIKVDANISKTSNDSKASTSDSKKASPSPVKLVMEGTGCHDTIKIQQILKEVAGDVDAAIEYIIAEKDAIDLDCMQDYSFSDFYDEDEIGTSILPEEIAGGTKIEPNSPKNSNSNYYNNNNTERAKNERKQPKDKREKEIYRGSAKQNKAQAHVMNGKGKKGKKQNRRREVQEIMPASRSMPDVGALCI